MTDVEITPKPVPRIVKVTRFRCPFCRFSRATKQLVVDHIARCWADPAQHTCRTCVFHVPFRRGVADPCFPGQPCDCDSNPEYCSLGVPLPEHAPVVSCTSWRDRDLDEDDPAEDSVDAGLRGLLATDSGEAR